MSKLQITGVVASIIGATVSVTLLLIAGKSTPTLLLVMFVGWVALPFVMLLVGIVWKGISELIRTAFSATSIVVTLASIAVYSYFTLWPLPSTPARTWLLMPAFSLIAIVAVVLFARFRRKKTE